MLALIACARSDDVMSHIGPVRQLKCAPLSLYTSSHLMYGIVVVFKKQQHYLIGLFLALHSLDF